MLGEVSFGFGCLKELYNISDWYYINITSHRGGELSRAFCQTGYSTLRDKKIEATIGQNRIQEIKIKYILA